LVMPSFCDRSVRCERSEAKAATLHVEAVTAKPAHCVGRQLRQSREITYYR